MTDKRRKPRWFQHLYARLFGYFWLPCPICGEHFGGQEACFALTTEVEKTEYGCMSKGKAVCANCVEEANRISKDVYRANGLEGWWFPALEE